MSALLATAAVAALTAIGFGTGWTLCGWAMRRSGSLKLGTVENKSSAAIREGLASTRSELGFGERLDCAAASQSANTPPPNIPASASSRANAAQAMVDFVREYPVPMAHWSSCAVNNAPALEPGPCDCGGYDPATKALDEEERAIRLFHALRIGILKPRKGVVEATWADLNEEQRDRYRAGVKAVLS